MHNLFLKTPIVVLCILLSQAMFSSAPVLNQIDQVIDRLTIEDTKDVNAVRSLIKANPERVLNHCVHLALKDFDKNNQIIDPRWHNFFDDMVFFNNQGYKKYFELCYEKNPSIKDLIHYDLEEVKGKTDRKISARSGLFNDDNEVGYIEYTSYDSFEERPEIDNLRVSPNFRRKGIATQLLKRAVIDLRTIVGPRDIHFTALPCEDMLQDRHGFCQVTPSLTLDQLISFYKKNGAVLVSKNTSSAQMKFTKYF